MNTSESRTSYFFSKIPENLHKRRLLVIIIFILMTVAMAAGLPRVHTDGSILSYFSKHDPVRKAYNQYRSSFGGDEILYLVYEARDGDVFSEASLKALHDLQDEFENYRVRIKSEEKSPLDHIVDVTSLINVAYLESKKDTLISRDFIGSEIPAGKIKREQIRQSALAEKSIPKVYFSDDSRFGGIVIETDFNAIPLSESIQNGEIIDPELMTNVTGRFAPADNQEGMSLSDGVTESFQESAMTDYVPFMEAIRNIIKKPNYASHMKFYPVGVPAFMDFVFVMIVSEMGLIILGMLFLVLFTTLILFRSLSTMIWSALIVIFSLIWTMGTVGWTGMVMPDLMIIVVFFVVAVSVADTIHILSGYLFFRQQNQSHKDAISSVYKKSGLACLLTSLTTAIGFASMLFVPIVSMQRIGSATAIGIVLAFFITILILPLMLDLWSPKPESIKKKESQKTIKLHWVQLLLRRIEGVGINNPMLILSIFAVTTIVFAIGIKRIHVESSSIDILRTDTFIRKAFDIADEKMGGTDSLEILVDTGKVDGLKDPKILTLMEDLQERIENEFAGTVNKTYSIADVVKDAYQALNNSASNAYIIPQDPDILSQTLFLFDNADPDDRRELVTDDYRIGCINVFSKSLGSAIGIKLMEAVDNFSTQQLKNIRSDFPNSKITMTGAVALRTKMYHYVSQSQMIGFGLTLGVISIVLLIALRSIKIGLLAMIPNLFPIVVVAGAMGYLDIPLDIHTLLVIPIIIGIAVDDTIHFLTHFQIERRIHGETRISVINSYREVGQAILFTSVVLSIGFLMFLNSKNMGFVYFGFLNAIAIIVAVTADLFLLPAILVKHFPSKIETSDRQINMKPEQSRA